MSIASSEHALLLSGRFYRSVMQRFSLWAQSAHRWSDSSREVLYVTFWLAEAAQVTGSPESFITVSTPPPPPPPAEAGTRP